MSGYVFPVEKYQKVRNKIQPDIEADAHLAVTKYEIVFECPYCGYPVSVDSDDFTSDEIWSDNEVSFECFCCLEHCGRKVCLQIDAQF